MTIKEACKKAGLTQAEMSNIFEIPPENKPGEFYYLRYVFEQYPSLSPYFTYNQIVLSFFV